MSINIVHGDTIIGYNAETQLFGIRIQGTTTPDAWVTVEIKTINTEPMQTYTQIVHADSNGVFVALFENVASPNNGSIKVRAIVQGDDRDPPPSMSPVNTESAPDGWYALVVHTDDTYDFDATKIIGVW